MDANQAGAAETVTDAASLITDRLSDEPSIEATEVIEEEIEDIQGEPESDPETDSEPTETEDDEPEEVEVSAEEAEDDEEDATYETIEQLAEAIDLKSEDFLSQVKGKVKIDGEVQELPLSEIINGYQREADYRRKTMELADNKRDFESQSEESKKQIGEDFQRSKVVLNMLANQLKSDKESVNWAELRDYEPGEFAAKQEEFRQREGQLKSLWNDADRFLQQSQQTQVTQQKESFDKYLVDEGQKLVTAIPEWSNPETAKAEKTQLGNYLIDNFGFNKDEIFGKRNENGDFITHGVTDHRFMLLAKQAMKANNSNIQVEIAEKKVKKLPKVVKPGAKLGKKKLKQQKNDRISNAVKYGSLESLGAAFADKL